MTTVDGEKLRDQASTSPALAEALAMVEQWEVRHAAVSVIGPEGPVATGGSVDRPFRLASVTKLLVAYAALVAVEEGTITLADAAGPPGATVRHLLAHASGIGFDDDRVLAPPATRRIYSNVGLDLVADHLGRRAGMAFDQYLTAGVLDPLGMDSTRPDPDAAATGAVSTVSDLARFAAEVLRPTLIHPETLADATRVQFPGLDGVLPGIGVQRPNDWGLGFERRDAKDPHWTGSANSAGTFGHFGAAGTFVWVDPAIDLALVVLTDRSFGPWALVAWPALSNAVVDAATSSGAQNSMVAAPFMRSR